jgi:thymidylate kinase
VNGITITISGPQAIGKSVIAQKIERMLKEAGYTAIINTDERAPIPGLERYRGWNIPVEIRTEVKP